MNTSTIIAIIIGSIVAITVLIIAMLLIIGEHKKKRAKISFNRKQELEEQKKTGSTYTAGGGFKFGEGDGTLKQPVARNATPVAPEVAEPIISEPAVTEAAVTEPVVPEPVVTEPVVTDTAADKPEKPHTVLKKVPIPAPHEKTVEEATPSTPTEAVPEPATEQVEAKSSQIDDVPSAKGRLSRLKGRLASSNNVFSRGILGILGAGDLDEDAWEEVEDTLIMADLGTTLTMRVVDRLRAELATAEVKDEAGARALLRHILIEECHPEMDRSLNVLPHDDHPSIILMVGVNGTGKTTTTGKLARVLVGDGRRVLLGAADTFRAAAADQLQTWGDRVGATTVRGAEGSDPASVAFDAVDRGVAQGVDTVLIDTAGRLHTKTGLMDELGKVKRVVSKKASVDEVLLVLDATVGQNGILQAKEFKNVVDISGVVLTKLDGTAKGGIVFQVQEELGVPVKLVGLGEGQDDLAPFEVPAFVDALLA